MKFLQISFLLIFTTSVSAKNCSSEKISLFYTSLYKDFDSKQTYVLENKLSEISELDDILKFILKSKLKFKEVTLVHNKERVPFTLKENQSWEVDLKDISFKTNDHVFIKTINQQGDNCEVSLPVSRY